MLVETNPSFSAALNHSVAMSLCAVNFAGRFAYNLELVSVSKAIILNFSAFPSKVELERVREKKLELWALFSQFEMTKNQAATLMLNFSSI